MIRLAEGLEFPDSWVTSSFALLAMKGAGKSNAAVVMAEQMYDAGIPWVAIDPKGDWWGVRSAADGKGEGLGVPIFGGLNGDVPIDEHAGAVMADLIVDRRLTCIIDTSEMGAAEMRRFLVAFCDRLYRLKNRATFPMHLFLEECDEYVPQRVFAEVAKLVRSVEMLVKRGRKRGIGVTLISQRSASINKDVLTQTDTLIVLRTTSPQDRKAVEGWINYHAAAKDVLAELPTYPDGDAWVSSPAAQIAGRWHFLQRRTFDSGATPELGETAPAARLTDVDFEAIGKALAAQVEKARAEDPALLRAELDTLRKRCAEQERALQQAADHPRVTEKRVEVPVAVVPPEARKAIYDALNDGAARAWELVEAVLDRYPEAAELPRERAVTPRGTPRAIEEQRERGGFAPVPAKVTWEAPPDEAIGPAHRKMLSALATAPNGLTRKRLASLTGYSAGGGRFVSLVGELKRRGLTESRAVNGTIYITELGREMLGPVDALPTGHALLDWWLERTDVAGFTSAAKRALAVLADAYPAATTREQLAEAIGMTARGGAFGGAIGRLRSLGLVTPAGDPQLTEEFGEAIQ